MTQKIIHIDMDAYYASVEQLDRPELRGKPVVVGGSPDQRGVVCAASYEARKYGVRSAMPTSRARDLCPAAIFVYPRFDRYLELSEQIRSIFYEVTDLVEPLSLDEAYLDVTQNKLHEPLAGKIARFLKDEIRARTGLSASAGVASTLFLAKVASDYKKPNGLTIIPPDSALDFISKLPIEKMWSVGPATAKVLHSLGIKNGLQLRQANRDSLIRHLGRHGHFLHDLAHGIDLRKVEPNQPSKSCGSETTFEKDTLNELEIVTTLKSLAQDIENHLTEIGRPARSFTLKVRYSDFTTITRSYTHPRFTNNAVKIFDISNQLLREKTEAFLKPIRLLGISATHFMNENEPLQLWLDLPEFQD